MEISIEGSIFARKQCRLFSSPEICRYGTFLYSETSKYRGIEKVFKRISALSQRRSGSMPTPQYPSPPRRFVVNHDDHAAPRAHLHKHRRESNEAKTDVACSPPSVYVYPSTAGLAAPASTATPLL